jgi:aryl-alcohol dehydrogenase-like predicted oxidoreductase
MIKVPLGKSGLEVSRIGLGCMGMSAFLFDKPTEARSDTQRETESLKVISEALDVCGINFFDTADIYGNNEALLARALTLRPRSSYIIATKFGGFLNVAPSGVAEALNTSLNKLGMNHVDLYYLHRVNPQYKVEDIWVEMAKLVKDGKTTTLGISEAKPETVRKIHQIFPVTALQNEFSIHSSEFLQDAHQMCKELGITFVAYSPLGKGFLASTHQQAAELANGDFRGDCPRFAPENAAHNEKINETIRQIAAKHPGTTPAQVALAWTLLPGPEVVPIPGTTRIARLHENAAAVNLQLTDSDIQEISTVVKTVGVAGERAPSYMMGASYQ